jgi:hypothetical protein
VAVPTKRLNQDERLAPSPKATPEQMRAYMSQVPAIYRKLGEGARPDDFRQMRTSSDTDTRAVGDGYYHLFSPAGTDHRLEAEVVDGKGLVVTRGRHRIEAARELGLPYVPVHVRAVDELTLDASTRNLEAVLEASAPGGDVVRAQRQVNSEHEAVRAAALERSRAQAAVDAGPTDRASRAMDSSEARSPSSGPSRGRHRSL